MKNIRYLFIATFLIASFDSIAQTFNWHDLRREQRHILHLNVSAEYAAAYGAGYNYRLRSKFPIVLSAEYSFPSGNDITDDFKTKIGGQIDWFHAGNFHFVSKIHGVFRRYQNDYARLLNFGSDLSGIIGYYKPKWFVAAEVGFDKAIVTHFKHTDLYKQNFPDIRDGWYEPSTGGNFYYGIQTGLSRKKFDVYLKAGKLIEQDFKTSPLFPVYGQVGVNVKFR
ncbi:MAG TPA: hypothetical protein VFP97_09550 [Chitinophagaceae bacterium]|nr:hypothetical protein [Chitinophagaceae bacterium]